MAIARLVARRNNLAGNDDLEQAKTDVVVDTCGDLQSVFYTKVYGSKDAKDEEKEAVNATFLAKDAPDHLAKIEKLISLYGSNGFSVGNSLKWSDLMIWDTMYLLSKMDATLVAKYPGIVGVNGSVEANEKVSAYINSRPETPF